jgi:ParB-like chromosome segregation protein Spo0J
MTGEEFERLKEDIKTRKLQEPIIIYDGKILDGRNRYNALKALGRTLDTKHIKEYRNGDPLGYVLSANLHRRHLNESGRAMVAGKLASLPVGTNRHTKVGTSIEDAGKRLNVGKASVERAKKVLDKGTPELVKAVEQNKVRVSAAADKLADKPPEEQKKILVDDKLLKAALKSNTTPLDRFEKAWDKLDLATQEALVEAKYSDLKKLMKVIDQKGKAA